MSEDQEYRKMVDGILKGIGVAVSAPKPEEPKEIPGGFKKGGDPRRGPSIQKVLAEAVYVPPQEDGAPELLMNMRHVWLNPKQFDKTEGQKNARKLKNKNPQGFLSQMAQMERVLKAKDGPVEEGEMDAGTEKCLKLVENWLKEHSNAS